MKFPWFDLFLAVGFAFLGGLMFYFYTTTPGVAGYAYLVLVLLDLMCAYLNAKSVVAYLEWRRANPKRDDRFRA